MANGTTTSHGRLTIAEILESPDRHEPYLAEVAAWAHAAIHLNTMTITGNTDLAPTRRQVTGALLHEADWLAERLAAARAGERTSIAHLLVFTGLGRESAALGEAQSELHPGLLRQGIIGEFHPASLSSGARRRNDRAGLSPWPLFALRAFIPQHD
jgi:Domain of unknown function (DUF6875)